jgi:hypothetical protein
LPLMIWAVGARVMVCVFPIRNARKSRQSGRDKLLNR